MPAPLDPFWYAMLKELLDDAHDTGAESLLFHFVLVDKPGEGFHPNASGTGVMLTELLFDTRRRRHKAYSMPASVYGQCLDYLKNRFGVGERVRVVVDPISRPTESLGLIFWTPRRPVSPPTAHKSRLGRSPDAHVDKAADE